MTISELVKSGLPDFSFKIIYKCRHMIIHNKEFQIYENHVRDGFYVFVGRTFDEAEAIKLLLDVSAETVKTITKVIK